jgi:hypothetical protein
MSRISRTGSAYCYHGVEALALSYSLIPYVTCTYFAQTRSEYYDFVNLTHFVEKVVDAGTFDNVDIVNLRLNLNGNDIIRR